MTATPTSDSGELIVPPPVSPDDERAWYAPSVLEQYEIRPGVVATLTATPEGTTPFQYDIREPPLTAGTAEALGTVRAAFGAVRTPTPRTRDGTVERYAAGLGGQYRHVIDAMTDLTPGARRRLEYYAIRDLRCLGAVTPLALDDRIEVGDPSDERLLIHMTDFAPVETDFPSGFPNLKRVFADRINRRVVTVLGTTVPVILYRDRIVGGSGPTTAVAILEPTLIPGDRPLIDAAIAHTVTSEDRGTAYERRVHHTTTRYLSRKLRKRARSGVPGRLAHHCRWALARAGLLELPALDQAAANRLTALRYHVQRAIIGAGVLTVPLRDPGLELLEATTPAEAIQVVPRDPAVTGRVATNLALETANELATIATELAARGGESLAEDEPTASVSLDIPVEDTSHTVRCALSLGSSPRDAGHVIATKHSSAPVTPIALLKDGAIPTDLVALVWLLYEHRGVVLFAGPSRAGKTALLNAHLPFLAPDDRAIAVGPTAGEIGHAGETGVQITGVDRDGRSRANADVTIIPELGTDESSQAMEAAISAGHGVLGTVTAGDESGVRHLLETTGLSNESLSQIDLIVVLDQVDNDRFVSQAVSPQLTDDGDGSPGLEMSVQCRRTESGSYTYPTGETMEPGRAFERIADREYRGVDAVRREVSHLERYVRYFESADVTEMVALIELLEDLRADEAATVERLSRE